MHIPIFLNFSYFIKIMNTSFTAFNNKTYLNIQKAITVNTRADNHCLTYYKLYIQKNISFFLFEKIP